MAPKDADNRYDDLLSGGVPPAQGDFSLEEILVEFGGGEERRLLRGTEAEEVTPPAPQAASAPEVPGKRRGTAPKQPAQPEPEKVELPPSPRPISLEEVAPEDWDDQVERPEIRARLDTVWILDGEKRYPPGK